MIPDSFFLPTFAVPARFRLATLADLRPLFNTCHADQPFDHFVSYFHHVLKQQINGRSFWLVGESPTALVASGQLLIYSHTAELANLFVVPGQRSQGIGRAMIEVLSRIGRFYGLQQLEVGVSPNNTRALSLYQRLGFVETRQLPLKEPVIILRKTI